MLPIIHPMRHPLLPSGSPETASVGHSSPGVSLAGSGGVPAPSAAPLEPAQFPKTENRSDFGQKRTDSIAPTAESSQSSTLHSQPLWSLQPDEPAADYQLFAAWLQLPPPRRFTKTAAMLGCSLHRLRRLSARHRWKTRAAAFDNHRASAASRALDQLLQEETSDWKERVERFRLQEWLLHEEIFQAASEAVRQLRKHPGRASLSDIARLYDLASVLGRRACGMPLNPPAAAKFEPPFFRPDVDAALKKIYCQSESWTGLLSGAH
jgi:hypothetical protein